MRLEVLETRQLLATFTVTNVADTGAGSFRQAILDSNGASGLNEIAFDIPGSGVHSIAPASPLPAVSNPAIIDATTEPGYAGTPLVELNGSDIFDVGISPPTPLNGVAGLILSGGSSTVRGLTIDRFTGDGIDATRDGNTIASDFIGTDPTGTQSLGNGEDGVNISSRNNTIGGQTAADRNLISGNSSSGVYLGFLGGQPSGNVVEGNFIGTDVTGILDLGNASAGVNVESASNIIGGPVVSLGNVIAFNGGAGVQVGSNIFVSGVNQNRITDNSIYGNAGLGIDLGGDGVTFNTPGGANYGPNNRQNYPSLTSVYSVQGGTQIEGTLNASPNSSYTLNFYSNLAADPSGFGQGRTLVGSQTYTTNAGGNADVTTTLPTSIPAGEYLSATATDSAGDTSEFSRSLVVASAAQSDLVVSASNPNPTAQAGVAQTYDYTVQNNGPSKATNVTLIDNLPAGATNVSATSGQGLILLGPGQITVAIGTLASGTSSTVAITYTLPTAGPASSTVTVTGSQPDPTPSNNVVVQAIQVGAASPVDLSLYGVSSPYPGQVGEPLTYTFVVTNFSGTQATGVTFNDPLPSSVMITSVQSSQGTSTTIGNDLTVNLGTIQGGANATVTVVVTPLTAGSLSNFATIKGNEPDPNAINNSTTVYTYVTPAPAIDVAVSVQAAPAGVVGLPFSYALIVGNPGTAPATGVTLTDILPDAAVITSIRPSQGTYSLVGNVLTVHLGSLAIGALSEVTVALVPGAPGFIVDRASVTADQPEFNIANNFDSLASTVMGQAQPPAVLDQKLTVANNKITSLVLTFNEAIEPTSATNILNYLVQDLGSNGSLTASGKSVAIASASYDAVTRSVTLTFRQPLAIGRFYKIIVNGPGAPGLIDTYGNLLASAQGGLQNGIYQSLVSRGTKTRPAALQVGASTPKPVHHAVAAAKVTSKAKHSKH